MDKARLEELKMWVNRTDPHDDEQEEEYQQDLIDILNAELARQVPDWQHKYRLKEVEREGTQNALDDARLTIKELRRELENVQNCVPQRPGEVYERVSEMACEYAEKKCQEPDGDVKAAERCVVELIREAHKRNNDSQYAHQEFIREYRDELRSAEKTVLAALRQHRKPEPCEWCDLEPSEQIFAYGMAFRRIPVNFCPSCGRQLGGD